MNCDRIRQLISESFDRTLTSAERLAISEHLQTCPECVRFQRTLQAGLNAVHRLPEIAPSRRLWETVHTQSAMPQRWTATRVARQAAGMVGAAAVVALVAALTIFLFHNHLAPTDNGNSSSIAARVTESPTAPAPVVRSFAKQTPATPETSPGTTPTAEPSPSLAASAVVTPPAAAPTDTPATAPTTTSTPAVDEKTAQDTVVNYFHHINLQDYQTAYSYLGSAMQQQQTYNDFCSGFAKTKWDTVTITTMKRNESGQMVVTMYLDAQQTDGSTRHFHGDYVVDYENGSPKIVNANVVEDVQSTPTPSTSATLKDCVTSNLKATADYQGATGSMAGSIVFTNAGSEPCVLEGTPAIVILAASGQTLTVDETKLNLNGEDQPVTVDPGKMASLFFVWSNWCPTGTSETSSATPISGGVSFQITFKGQPSITAEAVHSDGTRVTLVPRCGTPNATSTIAVGIFKLFPAR